MSMVRPHPPVPAKDSIKLCVKGFSLYDYDSACTVNRLIVRMMGRHRISYHLYPGVAQLVARVVWDHQAAGSNPVTRRLQRESPSRGQSCLKLRIPKGQNRPKKTHFSKLIERLGSILHSNVNIILVQVIINLSLMDEATLQRG